ncbi:MAG: hypothetical protein OEZ48_01965 [Candidatus Bathyarchaeota archaeon]|nr:hypothetical protein [Candidatus Bathyarchaeota archaeon]
MKIFSSGQIADWVTSLPSVVAHLKPDRANFKDIDGWNKTTISTRYPRDFVSDAERERVINSIRDAIVSNIDSERATIIRLVGHSGVGKTRLIYECLNNEELAELVLYADAPEKMPKARFNEIAVDENRTAILVVDECPHDKYVELAKEADGIGGRMTLITLDYDIDRSRDAKDVHIILGPLDKVASDALIKLTVPGLLEPVRRRIVEFSEGYPGILVSLSENFSSHPEIMSPETLSKLGIDDLFDRMIAGRLKEGSEVERIKSVLMMISLFRRLGWDDEVAQQGKKVCELHGIRWMEGRRTVDMQEERRLVVTRGRYRYVTPLPLAIYLASKWLEAMDEPSLIAYFAELPDLESKRAFLARLADLGYSERAKEVLGEFLSAFDYNLLDSAIGSEIFLSLSKADHYSSMKALERLLGDLPREKLLEFKSGRRNVIWALERIASWEDTFHSAANMLLKLADAENETWSNNATGVFTRLFQTFLAGTAVPAWDRHSVLEDALNSGDRNLQGLALRGIGASLRLSHVVGMVKGEDGGAEILPQEWNPRTVEDLERTVSSSLGVLDKALQLSSPTRKEAAALLLSHVRTLLAHRFKDEVMKRLQVIVQTMPEMNKEVIKCVENVIYYGTKRLSPEIVNSIKALRGEIIANDFDGLLNRYVKSRLLEDQLRENRAEVEEIVRRLGKEGLDFPEKLDSHLGWLVTDEAENGYFFGKVLGEFDEEYRWLDRIVEATRDSEKPSATFLGGYLSSVRSRDEDLWHRVLTSCYDDEILRKLLLEIIWRSGTSDKALELVISLLKTGEIQPHEIGLLTYGAWFRNISMDMFTRFLEEYYEIGNGAYAPVVLGIIDQYLESHPKTVEKAKDTLLKHLIQPSIFERSDAMTGYTWDKVSRQIMERSKDTIPVFLNSVLNALMREYGMDFEPYFNKKIGYCLNEDSDSSWTIVKDVLLEDSLRSWRLVNILKGGYAHFRDQKSSLLGMVPETKVWEWVKENPEKAPYVLARALPLHEDEPQLHPLARKLLVTYPHDEKIQSALSSNWHTEGWSGPESRHLEYKLSIARNWARDAKSAVSGWAKKEVEYLERRLNVARRREEESEIQ